MEGSKRFLPPCYHRKFKHDTEGNLPAEGSKKYFFILITHFNFG